jgi:hypothetical protein
VIDASRDSLFVTHAGTMSVSIVNCLENNPNDPIESRRCYQRFVVNRAHDAS